MSDFNFLRAECRNLVAHYRRKRGWSQSTLAYVCGVSRNTIISIEKNRSCPHIDLCLKIACALDVKVDDLFYLFDPLGY